MILRFAGLMMTQMLALTLILLPSTALAESIAMGSDSRLAPRAVQHLEVVIREQMQRQDLSGLAVGLVTAGEISYLQGFGFADIATLSKVTEDSRFRWASLSKPLTAVLAAKLSTAGTVSLETPIQRYLPEFRRQESLALNLRHLLSNQGGIASYAELPSWSDKVRSYLASESYAQGYRAQEATQALGLGQQLLFIPGSRYHYSTFGFILAGGVLEAASGKRFEQLSHEHISEPLQLKSLMADRADLRERVSGYRREAGKTLPAVADNIHWKLPGGGFSSNIRDLARWMQALMAGPFLSPAQRQLLWHEQLTSGGQPTGYGLGFSLSGQGLDQRISHSGAQHQTRTLMSFYPQRQLGMVLMSNSEWADLQQIRNQIESVLIKRPE
ncbi:MAG: hypothetical protein CVV27_04340 [Candidatus Melainabacteria bacterium HGW-Melainabacteria-1]|nr:MAG: hypothetical protein CVV27_04340 [Candidatus Melainabacteria bacterium HGW-Melainabacteria-1]